jgi:hypothetical protein
VTALRRAIPPLLALLLALSLPHLATTGCTAGASASMTLGMSTQVIAVGGRSSAVATVTLKMPGYPDSGVYGAVVTYTVAPAGVVALGSTTATTDSDGRAAVTVTGVKAGTAQVTATATKEGLTSEPATITVSGPAAPEHILALGGPEPDYLICPNTPGNTTAVAADIGGYRWVVGTQRDGPLALVIPRPPNNDQNYFHGLGSGHDSVFDPDGFLPIAPEARPRGAAITRAADWVYYLNRDAGGIRIVRSPLQGNVSKVIYQPQNVGSGAAQMVLSPDDQKLAFIPLDYDRVYWMPVTGGWPTQISLGSSSGPTAIWWLSDTLLLVSVNNYAGTGRGAIVKLSTAGVPPALVYNHGGDGMSHLPWTITTDRANNIIYDDNDTIARLLAPTYTTRQAVLTLPDGVGFPTVVSY